LKGARNQDVDDAGKESVSSLLALLLVHGQWRIRCCARLQLEEEGFGSIGGHQGGPRRFLQNANAMREVLEELGSEWCGISGSCDTPGEIQSKLAEAPFPIFDRWHPDTALVGVAEELAECADVRPEDGCLGAESGIGQHGGE